MGITGIFNLLLKFHPAGSDFLETASTLGSHLRRLNDDRVQPFKEFCLSHCSPYTRLESGWCRDCQKQIPMVPDVLATKRINATMLLYYVENTDDVE